METKERKTLRTGFSTGTAAAAASVAAAELLLNGVAPDQVEVKLPKAKTIIINVEESHLDGKEATAIIKKLAGDDPDVTNKARVGAIVSESPNKGVTITGGEGVGRLTKPGLVLPPGEWAINPVPRSMIKENLSPYLSKVEGGLLVVIFIEKGELLAKRTLNPRLGIVGGLSVLGTTGLVRPFSHSAYIATIDAAMDVAKAQGIDEIVLTTGGRSENFGRIARPDLPEEAFVQIADFYKDGLTHAVKHNFKTIGLSIFFGKAVKQAAGIPYTHAHKSDMDLSPLRSYLPHLPEKVKEELVSAPTALAALEILKKNQALDAVFVVAREVLKSARGFTGPGPKIWVRIFDFDGSLLAFEETL
ncbi:MAG: cobalt-precorrin-5B (C(1))-methyltransferase CbiD [Deltaproteobacteria bacterium]|nr:cobalt-precorrin-5B (C(1))-methyltransferase CbiD [Deltaproteobacteria bacterium]